MTEEQAIKGLKENLCSLCAYGSQNMDSCDIRECDNRDYINALEQEAYYKNLAQSYEKTINKLTKAIAEQQPSDDCVSRQMAIMCLTQEWNEKDDKTISKFIKKLKALPPVTPTHCIAEVRFSKDDLREICNERIEVECTHGTCKDCANYVMGALDEEICLRGHELIHKDFYCADFEK